MTESTAPLHDHERAGGRLSRRTMMLGLGSVAAAGGAVAAPGLPISLLEPNTGSAPANCWQRQYWTLENAGIAEWSGQQGRVFRLDGDGVMAWLRLVEIKPMPADGARPRDVSRPVAFALTFTSNRPLKLDRDRIFTITHGRYGAMPMFMSETGAKRLLAIFN